MFNVSDSFQVANVGAYGIIPLAIVKSQQGIFAFTKNGVNWEFLDSIYADGTYQATGFYFAGDVRMMANEARVTEFAPIREAMTPASDELLTMFTRSEITDYTLQIANTDAWVTQQLRVDPFIGAELEIRIGFASVPVDEFQLLFLGTIREETLTTETFDMRAEASTV